MAREHLSARTRQPGHDQSFRTSEKFDIAAGLVLPDHYRVENHPKDIAKIYGDYGVIPEAVIRNTKNGRLLFVEVKKQGPSGNAEERAYKHYAPAFIRALEEHYRFGYHPFATVFCEHLAVDARYTEKIGRSLDYPHYFLWENYRLDMIEDWLDDVRSTWLD
jgi:hypothetical protein